MGNWKELLPYMSFISFLNMLLWSYQVARRHHYHDEASDIKDLASHLPILHDIWSRDFNGDLTLSTW